MVYTVKHQWHSSETRPGSEERSSSKLPLHFHQVLNICNWLPGRSASRVCVSKLWLKPGLPSIILPRDPGEAGLMHVSLLIIRVFNCK